MISPDTLRLDDVRWLLQIAAEAGGMARQATLRYRILLAGLCQVLNARRAVYAVAHQPMAQQPPTWDFVLDITVPSTLAMPPPTKPCRWISAHSNPDMPYSDVFEALCRSRPSNDNTTDVARGAANERGNLSPHRPMNLPAPASPNRSGGKCHLSPRAGSDVRSAASPRPGAVSPALLHSIAVCRRWEDGAFQDRELAIFNLFNSEWVTRWYATSRRESDRALSPRLQEVLELFLEGHSAKQIAYQLDLSTYTAQDYLKELYRRHGVAGRNELYAYYNRRI
jgi:DNA-binding CsgD family transcriptional regulator